MALPIKLKTLAEIQAEDDGELFIVPGLVSSELTLMSGDPYAGKTSLAFDLIKSVTEGNPFLGVTPVRTVRKVAYLSTDAIGSLAQRAGKAGIRSSAMVMAPIYAEDLSSRGAWLELRDMMRLENIGMVFIDSTTDLAEDVNSPGAARIVTDGLRTLAESGCVVLNIHHLNKQGGMFGSTQFRKATRAEIELKRKNGARSGTVATRSNDAEPLSIPVTYNPAGRPFFTVAGEAKVRSYTRTPERTDLAAEARALKAQGKNYRDIAAILGISKTQVGRYLSSKRVAK